MKDFSLFLEDITPLLVNNKEEDIDKIRVKVNEFISKLGLDKSRLITRWIEIQGEVAFNILQVTDSETYFKVLNIALRSTSEYFSSRKDPLYLIAQLSIMSDWYSFKALDI